MVGIYLIRFLFIDYACDNIPMRGKIAILILKHDGLGLRGKRNNGIDESLNELQKRFKLEMIRYRLLYNLNQEMI